jgi:hypothetical protein
MRSCEKLKREDRNIMKGEIRTKKKERKGREKLIQKTNVRIQERKGRRKQIQLYAPRQEDVLGSGGIPPWCLT